MKIALLTTDNREPFKEYEKESPWFGTAPEALLQGFAKMPGTEVHVVTCTQRAMKSPAKLAENIFFHSLHVPKMGWLRTGYQGCVRAIRRKLREIKPDMVHGQGTERECAMGAVFSGYPNVLTIHGNMRALAQKFRASPGSYLWLSGLLESITIPRTCGVFCNSIYTESLVRPRNQRTWLVPNALREPFFAPIPEHRKGSQLRLINVGVISPRKRQVELLEMFKRLHKQYPAIQIEFVGQVDDRGAYGQAFLQAVERANEAGYGVYSGLKDVSSLIEALDRADGCVHFPSEEAFGLIVAEALARNLKFFGAREGGIVDIAGSIEGAELFSADDWSGLEESLRRWVQAGASGPRDAARVMAERYHPRVIAQRHVEIYREVLSPTGPQT